MIAQICITILLLVSERQAAEIYARCVRIKQFYCHDENQIKMYWPVVMNGRAKRFDCKGLNVPYTVATGQGSTEFCIKDANVHGTV